MPLSFKSMAVLLEMSGVIIYPRFSGQGLDCFIALGASTLKEDESMLLLTEVATLGQYMGAMSL